MSRTIAVLPVAAVEQHGPHLPVGVDTFINEGYLARAMSRVPDRLDVSFLPVQAVGQVERASGLSGTLTLTAETAIRAWTEIGDSVHRAGCRKLVFANSHGGNVADIDIVARDLRVRHGHARVNAAWHRLGYPRGLYSDTEMRYGHPWRTTRRRLWCWRSPDTVRMDRAENFIPAHGRDGPALQAPAGDAADRLRLDESGSAPAGAMGEAGEASADKGRASADHGARRSWNC
jgi:creatinine amidohydrolase